MNEEKATILTADKFEVKITKDEIAETTIAELEHTLHLRLDQIQKEQKQLQVDYDGLITQSNTTIQQAGEEIAFKDPFVLKVQELGLKLLVHTSLNSPSIPCTFSGNDNTPSVTSPLSIKLEDESYKELTEKLNQQLKESRNNINQKAVLFNEEVAQINKNLKNLPRYQRYIKSQLTRKALNTTKEGKDILKILNQSLPLSLPESS